MEKSNNKMREKLCMSEIFPLPSNKKINNFFFCYDFSFLFFHLSTFFLHIKKFT